MENQTPAVAPPPKSSSLVILLVAFFVLNLGLTIFFAFRSTQLEKQVSSLSSSQNSNTAPDPSVPIPYNLDMISATKQISPNGKLAVWLNGISTNPTELIVGNPDGTNSKIIKKLNFNGAITFSSPVWNPESNQVGYFTFTVVEDSDFSASAFKNLYTINPDGKGLTLLKLNVNTPVGPFLKTNLEWTSEGLTYTDNSNSVSGEKIVVKAR